MPHTVSMNCLRLRPYALGLEPETGEERRRGIEIGDGDADVIEALDAMDSILVARVSSGLAQRWSGCGFTG